MNWSPMQNSLDNIHFREASPHRFGQLAKLAPILEVDIPEEKQDVS